jgi:cobalt-zinc-cadmium efflux system outer membrane protein
MTSARWLAVAAALLLAAPHAGGAPLPTASAEPVTIPAQLPRAEALRLFRTRGLDLLIADAAVLSARGDVETAGAVYNPGISGYAGPTFNYEAGAGCRGCQQLSAGFSLTDNGALFDVLTGKRGLRVQVAQAAFAAARLGRSDAQRTLEFQVKQQYMQLAMAIVSYDFAREIQQSMQQTWELNKLRYPKVIDEGALARIEIQKLEAEQALDAARNAVRQAQLGLAFLLGVRTLVPDFTVEPNLFRFQVPPALANATEESLIAQALASRPDLRAALVQKDRAQGALKLARRLQFPDISVQMQYVQLGVGQDAGQPPSLAFGLAMNLPVFYQQQGEIRRAHADQATQDLQYSKSLAQVRSDVGTALSAFRTARQQVERMESTLLDSAQKSRDIVNLQYRAGSATLIDFLDAQRTYIAINQEYFQDLLSYWTAVYQLEQAIGAELTQ